MLKKILLAVGSLLVVLVVVVALRPSSYAVTRTTTVAARPEVVFSLVNDFHHWDKWSPWAKLDPNMMVTYSGAESGKGAVYEWAGNADVGKGRMTIRESHPSEQIAIYLEFHEPFASVSDTEFRFQSAPGGTAVTWAMTGNLGFMEKAVGLFMDMEAMIGSDFEKGLAQLSDAAKAAAPPPAAEHP
ncbi:MAG: SRPBCC family protein [Bryobacterales bacterium]|jgi:uncharacterized protein YndB with AHSA1/START domain|nr:SRPBCC family protein [Bryobacterales bacterium]